MVVAGILALALALPTGALFGVGYGTGVRIGYEQIYPLLFPKGARPDSTQTADNIKSINNIYNAIGGKEASQMGIAKGLADAMEIVNTNPDFRVLEERELRLFGLTPSSSEARTRYGLDRPLPSPDSSSEINQFNKDTGAYKYALYRTYSITQLNNIISSSTNQESIRIANSVLQEKLQSGGGASTSVSKAPLATPTGQLASSLTKNVTEARAFTAWQKTLIALQNYFLLMKSNGDQSSSSAHKKVWHNKARDTTSAIRKISQDYRNPNNGIRTAVLQLRQELANGMWKIPY